jgi:hypothetical protein
MGQRGVVEGFTVNYDPTFLKGYIKRICQDKINWLTGYENKDLLGEEGKRGLRELRDFVASLEGDQ